MAISSNISLRGLRTFCIAAQYESFRDAGEVLFITSSAVSHQIKSLETELGQRLFERSNRDLRLTDIGRSLYDEVKPLIGQINAVVRNYRKDAKNTAVRISVQPFFASEYFVPRLREFTKAHPQIDIQVGTSDESSEHHPSTADLSVRLFRTPPDNMTSSLLFPLRMVVAGSPEFKSELVVKKKAIVSEFPLIIHESRPKAWTQWSKSSGIQVPSGGNVIRLDSMIAVVRAAERGLGAALVPVPLADQWFKQGSIVRLFRDELVADVSYYLVSKEGPSVPKNVALLRDWIVQNFANST